MRRTPLKRKSSIRSKKGLKRSGFAKIAGKKPKKKDSKRGILALKTRAWSAFAKYIRNRDRSCFTCGHPTTEAGHFIHNSDKANKTLRGNALWYNEKNVHGQEAYCNRHRGGNTALYAAKLIEKYGDGIIQELHHLYQTRKEWAREEVLEIALKYEKLNQ